MSSSGGSRSGGASTVSAISANTSATTGTTYLASGTLTVTLPAPAASARVGVKNVGTGVVTIDRNGSELIDGVAGSLQINAQWGSRDLVSDGTNWFVV